ncbi:MAG: pyridoxamine 5'-phosphate oxidase family protein, partial [Alphaproteobacteria bacterium]
MANSVENKDFIPPPDPWALFQEWYELAKQSEPNDPDAMSLATVGKDGMPSVRMVLMKHFDKKGLVFFTNRHSRKGEQLDLKPKAAICLHWKSLHRQIRVEGEINQ